MGRAVGVDGEGHAHLTDGETEVAYRLDAGVGVEHLDGALIAEVYLGFIVDVAGDLPGDADARRTHLEASGLVLRLVFVLATQRSMDLRAIVNAVLRAGGDRQEKA